MYLPGSVITGRVDVPKEANGRGSHHAANADALAAIASWQQDRHFGGRKGNSHHDDPGTGKCREL